MRRKLVHATRKIKDDIIQLIRYVTISLFHPNLKVSKKTRIGRGVTIRAMKGSLIDIRDVYIKDYCHIFADINAVITIAPNTEVGLFNVIVAREKISIGTNSLLAEFVIIRDQNHDINDLKLFDVSPVEIGANVWLGAKVTVAKGVTIADGCVVGAHSFVNKSISEKSLVAGIPARFIKSI